MLKIKKIIFQFFVRNKVKLHYLKKKQHEASDCANNFSVLSNIAGTQNDSCLISSISLQYINYQNHSVIDFLVKSFFFSFLAHSKIKDIENNANLIEFYNFYVLSMALISFLLFSYTLY